MTCNGVYSANQCVKYADITKISTHSEKVVNIYAEYRGGATPGMITLDDVSITSEKVVGEGGLLTDLATLVSIDKYYESQWNQSLSGYWESGTLTNITPVLILTLDTWSLSGTVTVTVSGTLKLGMMNQIITNEDINLTVVDGEYSVILNQPYTKLHGILILS